MAERKSFAFRRVEMMDNEHKSLDRQIGRNQYLARKNKPIEPFRYQAELNAGKAQKNAPDNYVLSKKEW